METTEVSNERRDQIFAMLGNSRLELQLTRLKPDDARATLEQWVGRLETIPDDYLAESYNLAMRNHGTRGALIPKEILDAYDLICRRPGFNQRRERHYDCPWHCSVDGWIIVNFDNEQKTQFEASDYTYAKACPVHRPEGFKFEQTAYRSERLQSAQTADRKSEPSIYAPSDPATSQPAVFRKVESVSQKLFNDDDESSWEN